MNENKNMNLLMGPDEYLVDNDELLHMFPIGEVFALGEVK